LYESFIGDGDNDILFLNELLHHILIGHFLYIVNDLGASFVAEYLLYLEKLTFQDVLSFVFIFEDKLKTRNSFEKLFILFLYLLSFKSGKTLQLHIEDSLRLVLGELDFFHQA